MSSGVEIFFMQNYLVLLIISVCFGCHSSNEHDSKLTQNQIFPINHIIQGKIDTSYKVIHVFVSLCDNQYQGIVPVPKGIGNGQNPSTNLYWGCAFGVSTFFKHSKSWKFLRQQQKDSLCLERIIFKHKEFKYILVADAYNGKEIATCTSHFLKSCAGLIQDTIQIDKQIYATNSSASLLAYVGHDGLMDFNLSEEIVNQDGLKRDAIILACYGRHFFGPYLKKTRAQPILWSTGLMSPEAYTLHDAIDAYVSGQTTSQLTLKAAQAYSTYQHCSLKAALKLLVSDY